MGYFFLKPQYKINKQVVNEGKESEIAPQINIQHHVSGPKGELIIDMHGIYDSALNIDSRIEDGIRALIHKQFQKYGFVTLDDYLIPDKAFSSISLYPLYFNAENSDSREFELTKEGNIEVIVRSPYRDYNKLTFKDSFAKLLEFAKHDK